MLDEGTAWALLRAAARTREDRVGSPGAALVLHRGRWSLDGEADPAARVLLDRLMPVVSRPAGASRPWVVAHLAQSIDGRIALPDGTSRWISGELDLDHTHRLRALVDAVVVGARTVEMDDPQLTVRRVEGETPVRVVIDPDRRLSSTRQIFVDASAPTLRVVCGDGDSAPGELQLRRQPGGSLSPVELLTSLWERGFRQVLVEGGGVTVSRFLAAGCVDLLHLVIAPVMLGAGRPAISLPEPLHVALSDCPRPETSIEQLGDDWLLISRLNSPSG